MTGPFDFCDRIKVMIVDLLRFPEENRDESKKPNEKIKQALINLGDTLGKISAECVRRDKAGTFDEIMSPNGYMLLMRVIRRITLVLSGGGACRF